MTSMSDVYAGGVGTATNRRRRLLGAGLFAVGTAMVVGAIPVATTEVATGFGLGVYEARELGGVLAGLGLPAVFVGIFSVLPAGGTTRAAAAIGASVAVLGVAVFATAYPYNWISNAPTLALATTGVYSLGTLVTFWCLFVGLATFKRRNDPGGTARIELTDEGTVRVVTDERDSRLPGFGSVATFGSDPDGEVDTQTNRETGGTVGGSRPLDEDATILKDSSGSDSAGTTGGASDPTPASDGAGDVQSQTTGPQENDPAAASADVHAAVHDRGRPDEYCGNCRHFEYVRVDGEITPYCGFHGSLLEDMEACDQWESNS